MFRVAKEKVEGEVAVYIGHPSMKDSVAFDVDASVLYPKPFRFQRTRDFPMDRYEGWINQQINCLTADVCGTYNGIVDLARKGRRVALVCPCDDDPCHGNVLAKMMAEDLQCIKRNRGRAVPARWAPKHYPSIYESGTVVRG